MDIQSLEALVRAYIAHVVAEATIPLIRRIESLEAQVVGWDCEREVDNAVEKAFSTHDFSSDIREAVEACVESEVESEVSRQLDNIEIPDEYAVRDMVRAVLRDVTFTVETDI
jgi:hypothetical protein